MLKILLIILPLNLLAEPNISNIIEGCRDILYNHDSLEYLQSDSKDSYINEQSNMWKEAITEGQKVKKENTPEPLNDNNSKRCDEALERFKGILKDEGRDPKESPENIKEFREYAGSYGVDFKDIPESAYCFGLVFNQIESPEGIDFDKEAECFEFFHLSVYAKDIELGKYVTDGEGISCFEIAKNNFKDCKKDMAFQNYCCRGNLRYVYSNFESLKEDIVNEMERSLPRYAEKVAWAKEFTEKHFPSIEAQMNSNEKVIETKKNPLKIKKVKAKPIQVKKDFSKDLTKSQIKEILKDYPFLYQPFVVPLTFLAYFLATLLKLSPQSSALVSIVTASMFLLIVVLLIIKWLTRKFSA